MSERLISLVQADPILMIHALEHLGENGPIKTHNQFYSHIIHDILRPIRDEVILLLLGKHARHRLTPELITRLEKTWGQRAENMANLLQTAETLREIAQRLREADSATIRSRLRDANATIRPLVIQIIAQRRLPLEGDLIDLLSDPNVRFAAHEGLVRLARGTDFGPTPGTSQKGVARSIEKWRRWLALQRSASPENLAKQAAIAAGGKQTKNGPVGDRAAHPCRR